MLVSPPVGPESPEEREVRVKREMEHTQRLLGRSEKALREEKPKPKWRQKKSKPKWKPKRMVCTLF